MALPCGLLFTGFLMALEHCPDDAGAGGAGADAAQFWHRSLPLCNLSAFSSGWLAYWPLWLGALLLAGQVSLHMVMALVGRSRRRARETSLMLAGQYEGARVRPCWLLVCAAPWLALVVLRSGDTVISGCAGPGLCQPEHRMRAHVAGGHLPPRTRTACNGGPRNGFVPKRIMCCSRQAAGNRIARAGGTAGDRLLRCHSGAAGEAA